MENINISSLIGKNLYLYDKTDPFGKVQFFGKIVDLELPEGRSLMFTLLRLDTDELPIAIGSLIHSNAQWADEDSCQRWIITNNILQETEENV